jgi:inactivated superfamily I helicase
MSYFERSLPPEPVTAIKITAATKRAVDSFTTNEVDNNQIDEAAAGSIIDDFLDAIEALRTFYTSKQDALSELRTKMDETSHSAAVVVGGPAYP